MNYQARLAKCFKTDIGKLFEVIAKTKGVIWIIGNGGSFSVASHGALDLTKAGGKKAFAVDNAALITAYSNDYSFRCAIAYYLSQVWQKEDTLIALSTSGRSSNILFAVKTAKRDKIFSVGMTSKGSALTSFVDLPIEFNEKSPKILEDMFQITFHRITRMLENSEFGNKVIFDDGR